MLLHEGFTNQAKRIPDKVCLHFEDRDVTYDELYRRVKRLANAILSLDLQKGEKVSVLLSNCMEFFEIIFGVSRAGLCLVPVNYRLVADEVEYIVDNSDSKALIFGPEYKSLVEELVPRLSKVNNYIAVGGEAPSWANDYEELLARADESEPPVTVEETDLRALGYTSGTTGFPKGVVVHHTFVPPEILAGEWGEIKEDDVTLITGPLFHLSHGNFGPQQLYFGGKCVIMKSFKAEEALRLIEEHKITRIFALPTAFNWILGLPDQVKDTYDMRSVSFVCSAGSPLHKEAKLELMELFPNAELYDFYGATEIGVCTNLNMRKEMSKIDSVGHLAFGAEVRIVDDEGRDVPLGTPGTLYMKNVDAEFYNNPEATSASRMGEWFTAGDMLFMDEDGYYYIADRKQDMIISGGENVYPAEVERVLYTHPNVHEAAVIGVPDEKWGESVKAIVVLKDGEGSTADEIMEYCNSRLAGYKKPRSVDFMDELPKNAMGKILKRVLRETYWEGHDRRVS